MESIVAKAALKVASSSLSYGPGLSASMSFPKITSTQNWMNGRAWVGHQSFAG
jgi:hypothetical protein